MNAPHSRRPPPTKWPTKAELLVEAVRRRREGRLDPDEVSRWRDAAVMEEEFDTRYLNALGVVSDMSQSRSRRYTAAREILSRYYFVSTYRAEHEGCRYIHPEHHWFCCMLALEHPAFGFPPGIVERL